ncbi:uncharacterized protein C4orf3 homolog isoform X2 [Erinaceus europaeus]|nr:uncharacterized protein C4orf3 homolog isoform X2 [Erinaceus europaeus]
MEGGAEAAEAAVAAGVPNGIRERRGPGEAGRQQQQQNHEARPPIGAQPLPKHSYWLDLWLFLLIDVMLFLFVYLLP